LSGRSLEHFFADVETGMPQQVRQRERASACHHCIFAALAGARDGRISQALHPGYDGKTPLSRSRSGMLQKRTT
jgi:hypothetical protein